MDNLGWGDTQVLPPRTSRSSPLGHAGPPKENKLKLIKKENSPSQFFEYQEDESTITNEAPIDIIETLRTKFARGELNTKDVSVDDIPF